MTGTIQFVKGSSNQFGRIWKREDLSLTVRDTSFDLDDTGPRIRVSVAQYKSMFPCLLNIVEEKHITTFLFTVHMVL
jgi:hypothetical protein